MIKKGDIYTVQLHAKKGSHIQSGVRPVMVVSGNQKNKGNIINIVPLSSKVKRDDLHTHVVIDGYGLKYPSVTLCEHAMPIDKEDLTKARYVGTVTDEKLLDKITRINQMQFV